MSKLVLTDVSVTIATVDLSDHVGSVTLTTSVDEVETTAFGSTARTRVGGLRDNSVSLEFHQNVAADRRDRHRRREADVRVGELHQPVVHVHRVGDRVVTFGRCDR